MDVVITLTFDNPVEYEEWLRGQARAAFLNNSDNVPTAEMATTMAPIKAKPMLGNEATNLAGAGSGDEGDLKPEHIEEAVAAITAAAKEPVKKSRGRKARAAKKEAAPVKPTIIPKKEEGRPTAPPATEAAPAEGEKTYTLADSREVLTAYLAKPGNGAESLLKELKVHDAKRINEVPSQHIHGFLKRMVEAS